MMEPKAKSMEKVSKGQDTPVHTRAAHHSPTLQSSFGFPNVQQTAGNLAVQRMCQSGLIQAKLAVSQPGDPAEEEADRVADHVLRMPAEEETLQTKPFAGQIPPFVQKQVVPPKQTKSLGTQSTVSSSLEHRITALQGNGQPLAQPERAFFEPRFGVDFSQVRVHANQSGSESARAVSARAFTVGKNVVFGAGHYQPGTSEGRRLLGHELTHVVQQNDGQLQRAKTSGGRIANQGSTPSERTLEGMETLGGYSWGMDASAVPLEGAVRHDLDPAVVAPQGTDVYGNLGKGRSNFLCSGGTMIARQAEPSASATVPAPQEVKLEPPAGPRLYRLHMGEREIVLTESEYRAREADLARTMRSLARQGRTLAEIYRASHREHMSKTRGWAGTVSDFLSGVTPPSVTMWGPTIGTFSQAEAHADRHEFAEGYRSLQLGYQWLAGDIAQWKSYIRATIAGAEDVVATLQVVVEVSVALEVTLLTGGTAYTALGGGKLAAGAATVIGVAAGGVTAATIPGNLWEAARGTVREVAAAGVYNNLRYAVNGLAGMVMGVGAGFHAMFEGLATLFTNPGKVLEDLGKLGDNLGILWANRHRLWRHFESLPPEKQSYRVGHLFGVIESFLLAMEAGNQIGAALSAEAGTGAGGVGALEFVPAEVAVIQSTLLSLRAEAVAMFGSRMLMTTGAGGLAGRGHEAAEEAEEAGTEEAETGTRTRTRESRPRVEPYERWVERFPEGPEAERIRRRLAAEFERRSLPKGSKVRMVRTERTAAGRGQSAALTPEESPVAPEWEPNITLPDGTNFKPDWVRYVNRKNYLFQEHKEVLTIWEQSFFSRMRAVEKLDAMLSRHADIYLKLREYGCAGWEYSTNDENLATLLAERIALLRQAHPGGKGLVPPPL